METSFVPPGHTPEGGVLVGNDGARRRLVVFEDPQCPYCREFEAASGDLLRREVAAGAVAVEYRVRSFLGGFTAEDLLDLGRRVGLTRRDDVAAIQEVRYEGWVRDIDEVFEEQDSEGTPYALLDGRPIPSESLYNPEDLGALIRA